MHGFSVQKISVPKQIEAKELNFVQNPLLAKQYPEEHIKIALSEFTKNKTTNIF